MCTGVESGSDYLKDPHNLFVILFIESVMPQSFACISTKLLTCKYVHKWIDICIYTHCVCVCVHNSPNLKKGYVLNLNNTTFLYMIFIHDAILLV